MPFTSPPDLSRCTRLEIRYYPSTLDYFFPSSNKKNVLNLEEKNYIQSFKTAVVTNQERIKAFAKDVSLGTYKYHVWATIPYLNPVYINCYRNNKHVIFFSVCGDMVITKDLRWFKYPRGLPNLEIIEPPEIRPFKLRYDCASNMGRIYTAGPLSRRRVSSYPEPNQWCDVIMRDRTNTSYVSEKKMREAFKCPSAGEGKCHYAMNPHCKSNSLPDTVLLFETKAGWNQHGGPELFTIDNHDPKGGCVLLNDGTVKSIRTKQELEKLRWK